MFMSLSHAQALDLYRSDDLIGIGMEADAVRRKLHPEGVDTASIAADQDGLPHLIAQVATGTTPIKHVRQPVSVTLLQRASNNQKVSSDDVALGKYQTAEKTIQLGPIIGTGVPVQGCFIGNEMVGKVSPSTYTEPITLQRWILNDASWTNNTPT